MIHAGELIEHTLRKKGKTVTWFAQKMCCTRTHVYKIFKKKNLDIDLLWRASYILEYDLFTEYSIAFSQKQNPHVSTLDTVSNMDTPHETIF